MESCFISLSSHGIMDEGEGVVEFAAASLVEDETSELTGSSPSDFMDDASSSEEEEEGPLFRMSNLIAQLPFKRGLSKHFQGKSQSFTSLSNVTRLEDLAKPEKTWKKLNPSKKYGGVFNYNKALSCAKTITKKPSRGPFSSLGRRRDDILRNTGPNFPSPGDLSGQALLFA